MLARQSLNSISCVLRPKKKEEVPIIICKYRVIFAFPFHKKARRDVELPDCNSIQDFSQYILRQHLIGNVIGSSHSLIETVISSQNLYRQHSIENVSDCFIPFMIAPSWLLAPRTPFDILFSQGYQGSNEIRGRGGISSVGCCDMRGGIKEHRRIPPIRRTELS